MNLTSDETGPFLHPPPSPQTKNWEKQVLFLKMIFREFPVFLTMFFLGQISLLGLGLGDDLTFLSNNNNKKEENKNPRPPPNISAVTDEILTKL